MTPSGAFRGALAAALLLVSIPVAAQVDAPDQGGRRTLHALRVDTPPVLDGRLDDPQWRDAAPTRGFVQSDPAEGSPMTEDTEIRVLFDRDNLYLGVHCFDRDTAGIVVNELQRDFDSYESDAFGFAFDPFLDRRSGYNFFVNPGGARRDTQTFSDGRYTNLQWDGIWDARAMIVADGWVIEIVMPFKTLGLKAANVRGMGINFKRRIRRKNEEGYWSAVPRRFSISYLSHAGDLVGLGEVATGGSMRVKPFATADAKRGTTTALGESGAKLGIDAKYRVAQGIALDVTLNTDFSQADVDRQQINLTRFSLFFPEKRDFFLENADVFQFGDVQNERSGTARDGETQLFYSRRIGLSDSGQPLPLLGGARLSGQTHGWSVGAMNIQQRETDRASAANFTIARVRRDLLPYTDAGASLVYRRGPHGAYNAAYGVDFNTRMFTKWSINAYLADTRNDEATQRARFRPGDSTREAKFSTAYQDSFYQATVLFADIGEAFDPQVGFVPRRGVRNWYFQGGIHPRPRGWWKIREINPHFNLKFFSDRQGRYLTGDRHYAVTVLFNNSSKIEVSGNPQFDRLVDPFRIRRDVTIPRGDYAWSEFRLVGNTDKRRLVSGSYELSRGGFYGGTRTSNVIGATVSLKPHLSAGVSYNLNDVELPTGSFRPALIGVQGTYSFNPRMFVTGSTQFNHDTNTTLTNVRFTFTHHPLSDFIVVYEENVSSDGRNAEWRALTLKFTQLLQF